MGAGLPQAIVGEHDDLVIAQAIALFASEQDIAEAPEEQPKTPPAEWREDQWADYYNASPEQQRHLIEIWGRPEGL